MRDVKEYYLALGSEEAEELYMFGQVENSGLQDKRKKKLTPK